MPAEGTGGFKVIDPDDVGSTISLTNQLQFEQVARMIGVFVGSDAERTALFPGLGPDDAGLQVRRDDRGGAWETWTGSGWVGDETQWTTVVPTVTAGGLASGSSAQFYARYRMEGLYCHVQFSLLIGSGTSFGSGTWYFGLPFSVANNHASTAYDPYWWAQQGWWVGTVNGGFNAGIMRTSSPSTFTFNSLIGSAGTMPAVGSNGVGAGWNPGDRINGSIRLAVA